MIAEVNSYGQMLAALRARVNELQINASALMSTQACPAVISPN